MSHTSDPHTADTSASDVYDLAVRSGTIDILRAIIVMMREDKHCAHMNMLFTQFQMTGRIVAPELRQDQTPGERLSTYIGLIRVFIKDNFALSDGTMLSDDEVSRGTLRVVACALDPAKHEILDELFEATAQAVADEEASKVKTAAVAVVPYSLN